ncbi:hypothetical protein VTO42DRAFT_7436 [Malbranchea cinnamomea]
MARPESAFERRTTARLHPIWPPKAARDGWMERHLRQRCQAGAGALKRRTGGGSRGEWSSGTREKTRDYHGKRRKTNENGYNHGRATSKNHCNEAEIDSSATGGEFSHAKPLRSAEFCTTGKSLDADRHCWTLTGQTDIFFLDNPRPSRYFT